MQKKLDRIQHPFMMKPLNKGGTYPQIIKAIYDKPTVNIILSGEKLKPSKIRNKTRVPTLATFIQHSIGSPNHSNQT